MSYKKISKNVVEFEVVPNKIHVGDLGATFGKLPKAISTYFDNQLYVKPTVYPNPTVVNFNGSEKTLGFVPNGDDNLLIYTIKAAYEETPVAMACLDLKEKLLYGSGIKYGKKFKDANKEISFEEFIDNKVINDFLLYNDVNIQLLNSIIDFNWFQQCYVELIFNNESQRKIVNINALEYMFTRLEEINPVTKRIENIIYYSDWQNGAPKDELSFEKIPLVDKNNPIMDILIRTGNMPDKDGNMVDKNEPKLVMCMEMPTPGHPYYPRPKHYSAITSKWIDFAKKILSFKNAILDNQSTIKYHIEYPDDYFVKLFSSEGIKDKNLQKERMQKEYADMDTYLKGVTNTGKSLKTFYKTSPDGKEYFHIKITVLDNKFKGGEYIDDSHEASAQIYTAFSVHPDLVGIIPGKSSSSLSGSNTRELLRIEQTKLKPARDILLNPYNAIKIINGWGDDIQFSISDMILTTLDQGKEVQKITQ